MVATFGSFLGLTTVWQSIALQSILIYASWLFFRVHFVLIKHN